MYFDEDMEMYVCEIDGIVFTCGDEPSDEYEESLKPVAEKYWSRLDYIVEFMMPDLQEVYGVTDADTIKEKLGKPTIDIENGTVDYFEQSFDDVHIFRFEFLDSEFEDLQYFSIDG